VVTLWRSVEGILLWRIPVYCVLALAEAWSTILIITGILLVLGLSGRLSITEWLFWGLAIVAYLARLGSVSITLVMVPFPSRARERWISLSMERLLPAEHSQFSEYAEAISPTAPFAALIGWRLKVESHLWRFERGYSEEVLAGWAKKGEGSIGEKLDTTADFYKSLSEE
jgi:hypothetical protein